MDKPQLQRELFAALSARNRQRVKEIIKILQGKRIELATFFDALKCARSQGDNIPDDVEVVATGEWKKYLDELKEKRLQNEQI